MDASAKARPQATKIGYALLLTALSPLLPQILGSAFNIWYNIIIVDPLLTTAALKQRFLSTVVVYNSICYPIVTYLWLRLVYSLRPAMTKMRTWRADLGAHAAGGAATSYSSAIPRRDHLRLRLAALHTDLYFFTCAGAPWFGLRDCFGTCRFRLECRASFR